MPNTSGRKHKVYWIPPGWEDSDHFTGLVRASKEITEDQASWLSQLPFTKLIKGAAIAHASINEPEAFHPTYSFQGAEPSLNILAKQKYNVAFLGHTHVQEIFHHPNTEILWETKPHLPFPLPLPP